MPDRLTGVVAIDVGVDHNLALKQDGTIVAWGSNLFGETTVPDGLSGVTAVAAGSFHSLAVAPGIVSPLPVERSFGGQ